jgi:hypothetical protein
MSLLADQLIAKLTIDQEVTWTPSKVNLDAVSFHDFATRVLELAIDGTVEAIQTHRESRSGNRYWDLIRFKRLK